MIANQLRKIEELEKRVQSLEAQKKDSLAMFGRSYSQVGSSGSDFLIKTKGQIKVQWGSKFIDLIKDGKINADLSFVHTIQSVDKIGTKEGIYLTDDGKVYLKFSGKEPINIVGETGNTYVSFFGEQETDSNSKYIALKNIGFIYPDLESLGQNSLRNGIIYIESEQKLYIVSKGQLSEFNLEIPNPYNKQFVISKDDSQIGAVLIKGSGLYNSLAFDSFYIFTEEGKTYLQANNELNISIDNNSYITVNSNKTTIQNTLEANTIQSVNATGDTGFAIIQDSNGSTLFIDNIVVRNKSNEIQTNLYPTIWSNKNNIVTEVNKNTLTLKYKNQYIIGDQLYIYGETDQDSVLVPVEVISSEQNKIEIRILLTESLIPKTSTFVGKTTFLIKGSLLRYSEHSLDLVECSNVEQEQDLSSVQSRLGNLTELNLKGKNNNSEADIEGSGFYTRQGYFDKAGYTSNYNLPKEDNSSRFASTEWVNEKIDNIPQPGYYYSLAKTENSPIDPQFIGTDKGNFKVSEKIPYLWKTSDGKIYILVDEYVNPIQDRIYISSTLSSIYTDYNIGKSFSFPAGFIAYYSNNSTITKLGKSSYITPVTTSSNIDAQPVLTILKHIIQNPNIAIVPQVDGYRYIWSIEQNSDMTNINNWRLERSLAIDTTFVNFIQNADWGNSTASPGYSLFEISKDNVVIGTASDFVEGEGTTENWNDEMWVKSFLRQILSIFLTQNQNRYIPDIGWTFNWDGQVNCFGYGGEWFGRISGISAPTSDDPNDIDYLPTASLSELCGYTVGNGLIVHFVFDNVKLGLQLPYVQAATSVQVGNVITDTSRKYYNVTYGGYSANIQSYKIGEVKEIN